MQRGADGGGLTRAGTKLGENCRSAGGEIREVFPKSAGLWSFMKSIRRHFGNYRSGMRELRKLILR